MVGFVKSKDLFFAHEVLLGGAFMFEDNSIRHYSYFFVVYVNENLGIIRLVDHGFVYFLRVKEYAFMRTYLKKNVQDAGKIAMPYYLRKISKKSILEIIANQHLQLFQLLSEEL